MLIQHTFAIAATKVSIFHVSNKYCDKISCIVCKTPLNMQITIKIFFERKPFGCRSPDAKFRVWVHLSRYHATAAAAICPVFHINNL